MNPDDFLSRIHSTLQRQHHLAGRFTRNTFTLIMPLPLMYKSGLVRPAETGLVHSQPEPV